MSGCRFSVSHQSYGPATSSELSSPIVSGLYGPDKKKTGTRIARNDKGKTYYVPADMTYHEWFDKYVSREVAENFRRKIAADGHEIIDQPTYNKLTKKIFKEWRRYNSWRRSGKTFTKSWCVCLIYSRN